MAEFIDNSMMKTGTEAPSTSKVNAALTTGIIGTALGALATVGSGASLFGHGTQKKSTDSGLTNEDVYLERDIANKYIDITKQFYEGKIETNNRASEMFFDSYKRDVDNSFGLYKYTRDTNDALAQKIADVDKKVDIMAAVRPYQDALINAKIDNASLVADFNLCKRTCRMIEGNLVLPDVSISGFESATPRCYH